MTTDSASQPASQPASEPVAQSTFQPSLDARSLLKTLQERYTVFRECQPLAIGIDKQIIAQTPDVSRKLLRTALGIHTHSSRYLRIMEKATVRYNLDGTPADEITEMHRSHAATTLKERFRKNAEQRKTQQKEEAARRAAEEAQRVRAEKLNQLAEKFSGRH